MTCIRPTCAALVLSLFAAAQQPQQPTQADRDEARRQGEERSRQQREREQQNINYSPDSNRRVYPVEGKVLMAGGGPPPARVAVGIVCGGRVVARSFANSKGAFGMQIGAGGGANGTLAVSDCVVVADLAGHRAEPFRLDSLSSSMQVTFATLILKPVEGAAGYTSSSTSIYASKEARKAHEKGTAALTKQKLDEAEKELGTAVRLHPTYAQAWYDLGRVLMQMRKTDEARQAFESALAADPKFINPQPYLVQIAVNEQRWEDVVRHTSAVIALNPFYSADMYMFSAQANLVLDKLDTAEAHAREAVKMDQAHRFPVAHRLLARILARKGNTSEALLQLKLCLDQTAAGSPEVEKIRQEIAVLQR